MPSWQRKQISVVSPKAYKLSKYPTDVGLVWKYEMRLCEISNIFRINVNLKLMTRNTPILHEDPITTKLLDYLRLCLSVLTFDSWLEENHVIVLVDRKFYLIKQPILFLYILIHNKILMKSFTKYFRFKIRLIEVCK